MIERVGPLQLIVMDRARSSTYGLVVTVGFLEARACRRLVQRGLMAPVRVNVEPRWHRRPLFRHQPEVYELTEYGRTAEIRHGGTLIPEFEEMIEETGDEL